MFTVNLYYTGKNGAARRFAEEMESSGTAAAPMPERISSQNCRILPAPETEYSTRKVLKMV